MQKTYYIFRHGETFATKAKMWYWHKYFSAVILEEGKPSILRLAKYLKEVKSDYNVRSPFLRCKQTADLVTDVTGHEFVVDKRIKEYGLELPWFFRRRIKRFADDMEQSDNKIIIICTHAGAIVVLTQYLSEGYIGMKKRIKAPLPGVLTIIKDHKVQSIDFNKA